jgi:AcrR family transcriptional regulator
MTIERRSSGRPRDPRIESAALDAARALLLEVGWAGLSMAGIAARAGTTKPALYRRWLSLPQLVYEAAFPDELALEFHVDADTFHADLEGIVRGIRDLFTSPVVAAALPGLLAEFSMQPELHASLLARFADGFADLDERITRAVADGEVREGVAAEDLLRLAIGTTLVGVLLGPKELDDAWADRLTDTLWKGLAQ